jgi:hypothetical protein
VIPWRLGRLPEVGEKACALDIPHSPSPIPRDTKVSSAIFGSFRSRARDYPRPPALQAGSPSPARPSPSLPLRETQGIIFFSGSPCTEKSFLINILRAIFRSKRGAAGKPVPIGRGPAPRQPSRVFASASDAKTLTSLIRQIPNLGCKPSRQCFTIMAHRGDFATKTRISLYLAAARPRSWRRCAR